MSVVRAGVAPGVQTQLGSPSSRPLLKPSPSLSAAHNAAVHEYPAPENAIPNGFLAPPPPCALWPGFHGPAPLR
jgi:hypothetical protein